MKKTIMTITIFVLAFTLSGCIKRDQMENIDIITTIYPIEYLTSRVYSNNANIISIYPKDTDYREYSITKKQIKDYSSKDLFIYNGTDKEKDYTIKFLNQNKNLKIIDASYGISYKYNIREIWLNPANTLMMAQNIKSDLQNYISNPYMITEIDEAYNVLKLDITELDASFTKLKDNASNTTIITGDDSFNFLEKYGVTVINLTKETINDKNETMFEKNQNNINKAETLLSSKKISHIYICDINNNIDIVNNLKEKYKIDTIALKTLATITDEDINNNEDYISIMYKNIDLLKQEIK